MNAEAGQQLLNSLQHEWIHLLRQAEARIVHCVQQLDVSQFWWRPGADQNSVGTIIQHVTGNLNQWVVHGIPQSPFERNRLAEFGSPQDPAIDPVLSSLKTAVENATHVISKLSASELQQVRQIQGFHTTVLGALMHSVPHLVGHAHQVVQLARQQLGDGYRFHWDPDGPRDRIPL